MMYPCIRTSRRLAVFHCNHEINSKENNIAFITLVFQSFVCPGFGPWFSLRHSVR